MMLVAKRHKKNCLKNQSVCTRRKLYHPQRRVFVEVYEQTKNTLNECAHRIVEHVKSHEKNDMHGDVSFVKVTAVCCRQGHTCTHWRRLQIRCDRLVDLVPMHPTRTTSAQSIQIKATVQNSEKKRFVFKN
jgi:hypothetical protein